MTTIDMPRVRAAAVMREPAPGADVHDEPAGNFSGRTGPDAAVGSFGNRVHRRREGHGTFRGDADRQREGSFGDHDLAGEAHLPDAA